MKFSIIVPVYNTEKYLKECLESLINQTYKNFEVIIINDGSTDNSESIIKKYLKDKRFKYIKQKNNGLSYTRNKGVTYATGNYILFLDSDDYFEDNLLKELNDYLIDNPVDLLRFQLNEIREDKCIPINENGFNNFNSVDASKIITTYKYVEPAWLYAYKKDFYLKNKFKYSVGLTHEDFGLTPKIINKAKTISSLNILGYNYRIRQNSIMTSELYGSKVKKIKDSLEQGMDILNKANNKYIKSYVANCMLEKICFLEKKDYKLYKSKKIYKYILSDGIKRKIKKLIIIISPKLYYKRRDKNA